MLLSRFLHNLWLIGKPQSHQEEEDPLPPAALRGQCHPRQQWLCLDLPNEVGFGPKPYLMIYSFFSRSDYQVIFWIL